MYQLLIFLGVSYLSFQQFVSPVASEEVELDWCSLLQLKNLVVEKCCSYETKILMALKILEVMVCGIQIASNEGNKPKTHIEITKATTRLCVTRSWYLRCKWMAKNRSTISDITPKKDVTKNSDMRMVDAVIVVQLGLFPCNWLIINAIKKG